MSKQNSYGWLLIIAFLFGLYTGYIHMSMRQAYTYISDNIDEYNLYLFKKAKLEIDPTGQRLKYGIDSLLIDRLNETDWYGNDKELILMDINN